MTIEEMHIAFKLKFDKLDLLEYPNLEPEAIDFLLNQSQIRLLKNRYQTNNNYREGFEGIQKRIDDLRTLVKSSTQETITNFLMDDDTTARIYEAALPSDYFFMIKLRVKVNSTALGDSIKSPRQAQHDDVSVTISDPFDGPKYRNPLLMYAGTKAQIVTDNTFSVTKFYFDYLKKPYSLSIDATGVNTPAGFTNVSEFPEQMHHEIVDYAVELALENIESPRYQTTQMANLKTE